MSFIKINNLVLELGNKTILKNINLNLNKGDRCILIGINGSGKTCLLRTMSGMHIIKDGILQMDNKTSFQDQCNGIAFLGESWTRSVSFSGHSIAYQADIKVKEMMKKVQIENIERKEELENVLGINPEWKMHLVSSGQRRRVRLFLGLLKPFKIALIDEMTMDLDIITRVKFMNWLKKESIERKACIVYATHIYDGLNEWPTHIAHIKNGGLLEKAELYNKKDNIEKIAFNLLSKDYEYLNSKNILELEDGQGKTEEMRTKNKTNGPQRGYASGRLSTFNSNIIQKIH